MKPQRFFLALRMVPCCLLLVTGALRSQMPSAPGRLAVKSTPPGATITIDNQRMKQPAPFTYLVSPGSHKVTARGPAGRTLKCSPESPYVGSGSTVEINCAAGENTPSNK
jgi:hypothetical protein